MVKAFSICRPFLASIQNRLTALCLPQVPLDIKQNFWQMYLDNKSKDSLSKRANLDHDQAV